MNYPAINNSTINIEDSVIGSLPSPESYKIYTIDDIRINIPGKSYSTKPVITQPKQIVQDSNINKSELAKMIETVDAYDGTELSAIDKEIMLELAQSESNYNFNAQNPTSSAYGMWQITDGTWKSLQKKYNILTDKTDPSQQILAMTFLLKDSDRIYNNTKDKHNLTEKEAKKLIHYLGSSDFKNIISGNPLKVLQQGHDVDWKYIAKLTNNKINYYNYYN